MCGRYKLLEGGGKLKVQVCTAIFSSTVLTKQ
jgi:hypothetical protein